MHPTFIILLLVTTVLVFLSVWPKLNRKQKIKWALVAAVIIFGTMAATGRVHWIGVLLAGLAAGLRSLLPTLIRLLPLLQQQLQRHKFSSKPEATQESEVQTSILTMRLDHESGELSGEVLQGPFAGMQLHELTKTQCEGLMIYCEENDQSSVEVLQTYLEQRFGETFASGSENRHYTNDGSAAMDRTEALSILGLEEGVDREEIILAHRKLIQKLHPDRGGNDYLAAKINMAKDVLLA